MQVNKLWYKPVEQFILPEVLQQRDPGLDVGHSRPGGVLPGAGI